jgi:enediyne biosynthesis protein E4
MGVSWGDYDGDGWPDLFVANDQGPNFLYHNLQNGKFEEDAMLLGVALSQDGHSMGNMAGDFGDYDRDGKFDLVVTRYGYQPMTLYHNQGAEGFLDTTWNAKIFQLNYSPVRWGSGFADFDNDGWPDIFVANGNVSPLVDTLPDELKYREPIQLYRNFDGASFNEVADISGLNDSPLQSRRGTAFGDINNDGNVDVVVYNIGAPPSVFLNESKTSNHRVLFRLVGAKSNRAAIGARMTVITAKMTQIDEVHGGGSYLSSNDTRLHFGLGQDSVMTKVEVQWPSGKKDVLNNVAADALYTVVEGKGIVDTTPLNPPPK